MDVGGKGLAVGIGEVGAGAGMVGGVGGCGLPFTSVLKHISKTNISKTYEENKTCR